MFRCTQLSTHWKHAEGMSLRYDAICALSIVTDIIHRICHAKGNEIFYLSLKRNVRTCMAGQLVGGAIQLRSRGYIVGNPKEINAFISHLFFRETSIL